MQTKPATEARATSSRTAKDMARAPKTFRVRSYIPVLFLMQVGLLDGRERVDDLIHLPKLRPYVVLSRRLGVARARSEVDECDGDERILRPLSAGAPTDAQLYAAGWVKRSRRDRHRDLQSRPRVGQAYWVDFAHDHYEPEFCGEHPGVVIRAANSLNHDTCVVVPLTTRGQPDSAHCHRLTHNPNPKGQSQGLVAYAVCSHFYTVHINRLRPFQTARGGPVYPKVHPADLVAISTAVRLALATLLKLSDSPSSAC